MKIKQIVRDYPITLTVSVHGVLANFAVAFTQPTFAVFALLFTGAVLVKGRHTVTRMLLAAGVHAAHHARFHRFFSRARWDMDDLWAGLVRLLAQGTLPADVLAGYNDRWTIECLFHEVKARMGFEEPQCRTERAVERTTPFLLWTAGIVQYWFLNCFRSISARQSNDLRGTRVECDGGRLGLVSAESYSALENGDARSTCRFYCDANGFNKSPNLAAVWSPSFGRFLFCICTSISRGSRISGCTYTGS